MIDGKPRIGDEVYIHGYIDEIRKDVVIIRNEGGYFGTSDKEMFYYEEDERGYGTMNEADRKTENSSEKPNNCEHITEDGVTCVKYPACDDCLDNPLNKLKGSERFVKGSEQTDCLDRYDRKTEPTISKMEQVETMSCAECKHRPIGAEICEEPCHYEPQTDWHYDEQDATWYPYKHEDEPQTCSFSDCDNFKNPDYERCIECKRKQIKLKTEQTERSRE